MWIRYIILIGKSLDALFFFFKQSGAKQGYPLWLLPFNTYNGGSGQCTKTRKRLCGGGGGHKKRTDKEATF